jgi:hypothetical protein
MSAVTVLRPTTLNDRVMELLQRVDYRLATTADEREPIYALRYNAYLREGAISANSSKRFADPVDEQENTWIFGVYIEGLLASSIRLTVTTARSKDIPALHVFSDVLPAEIENGRTMVDPTRFVADRELSRRHPELPYVTLRLPWIAMEHFKADWMFAAVREEHQGFYKRLWGHQILCPPRPYPELDKPISLMTLDYRSVRDEVHRQRPFFRSNYFERRMLFGQAAAQMAA